MAGQPRMKMFDAGPGARTNTPLSASSVRNRHSTRREKFPVLRGRSQPALRTLDAQDAVAHREVAGLGVLYDQFESVPLNNGTKARVVWGVIPVLDRATSSKTKQAVRRRGIAGCAILLRLDERLQSRKAVARERNVCGSAGNLGDTFAMRLRSTRGFVAAGLFAAGMAVGLSGQRGGPPPPVTGTGFLAGQVVESPSGQPIAGATVILGGIGGGRGGAQTLVLTDSQGRFFFANLPPGFVAPTAFKAGYTALSGGRRMSWPRACGSLTSSCDYSSSPP